MNDLEAMIPVQYELFQGPKSNIAAIYTAENGNRASLGLLVDGRNLCGPYDWYARSVNLSNTGSLVLDAGGNHNTGV